MKLNSTIKWYNQNATSFKLAVDKIGKNDLEQLNEFLELVKQNGHILDVGSGSGRDVNIFYKKGFYATGMDPSKIQIQMSRKSYPKAKFVIGSMTKIPFSNDFFDGLWVHASLLHIEKMSNVKKAISEFNRVCKKNAIIHIFVRAKMGKFKKEYLRRSDSEGKRLFRYFSQEEVKSLLTNLGFEIITIEQYPESRNNPSGRPNIDWIVALARKVSNI